MVTVFANNQALTCMNPTISEITTDPVSLGDADRATVNMNVHYIWAQGGTTTNVAYQAQVSNDGVYWVDVTGGSDSKATPTASTPAQKVFAVNGAFLRFKMTLSNVGGAGGELGGACIDLHVNLDHA